ncbi:MAG TPA: hypothetical protein VJ888_05400 [Mobilitalea sp.]|nr:hypothetical protein [Mobilitalea sp.]
MAKCKLCKTDIPEGIEYCKDCLDKKSDKTNESYLDSLLNSVKNNPTDVSSNYKKNSVSKTQNTVEEIQSENEDSPKDIDINDLIDFGDFNINDDLDDHIVISDEELFGKEFSTDELNVSEEVSKAENKDVYYDIAEPVTNNQEAFYDQEETETDNLEALYEQEEPQTDNQEAFYEQGEPESESQEYDLTRDDTEEMNDNDPELNGPEPNIDAEFLNSTSMLDEEVMQGDFDPSIDDLLNELDMPESGSDFKDLYETEPQDEEVQDEQNNGSNEMPPEEHINSDEDDFMSLLSQFSTDDPATADVQAISDLLSGKAVTMSEDYEDMPGDVGEVFSDALTAVSSLQDPDLKPKKHKKSKKGKKKAATAAKKEEEPAEEKGMMQKLFGNIADEKVRKKSIISDIAVTSETSGAMKKKSKKKGKVDKNQEGEDLVENANPPKEKKEKIKKVKKNKNDIIQVIDDFEEEEGRINRLGAVIVFAFLGLMVLLLLLGTSIFSYTLSVKNAKTYFERRKYTQAYNEIYGMDIKDEDLEIYEKIVTVMFVNKQLNSYNNYFAMEKYPEALDSLLKGLSRYDKYIKLATMLGIETDLNYVRGQIMAELNNVFDLSDEAAAAIISSESQLKYSVAVYDIALENIKY